MLFFVIPAEAGIQEIRVVLDSRFHGSDGILDFLRSRYPFNTAIGLSFATIFEMPAPCTTPTTCETSL